MRHGAGPNGVMRSLGQYMLTMGLTFGGFMSIGTVIRTEGSPLAEASFANVHGRPIILSPLVRRRSGDQSGREET